jgi:hypothetical protein
MASKDPKIEAIDAFFTQLGKAGFQADPLFLEANDEYVVDVHRGWTTEGVGQVDTLWALVWHFNADGKADRVVNLSSDQHQMDAFVWNNYPSPRSRPGWRDRGQESADSPWPSWARYARSSNAPGGCRRRCDCPW